MGLEIITFSYRQEKWNIKMLSSIYWSWENCENGHNIDKVSKRYQKYFWCQKACLGITALFPVTL